MPTEKSNGVYLPACKSTDLPAGKMRALRVGKTYLVVAHLGDEFFAFDYNCPHMRFPLSVGQLDSESCTIRCALHHSVFDLRDGHVVHWSTRVLMGGPLLGMVVQPRPLGTYPVRVENGQLLVQVAR